MSCVRMLKFVGPPDVVDAEFMAATITPLPAKPLLSPKTPAMPTHDGACCLWRQKLEELSSDNFAGENCLPAF